MTGAAGYGAWVPMADATSELPYPGMVRLALELLWSQLDLAEEPEERAAEKALWALHKKLWDKELEAVAAMACAPTTSSSGRSTRCACHRPRPRRRSGTRSP